MITLGIESSCDETSVAILDDEKVIINLISSQSFHALYGGVVPELSSRAHLQIIIPLLKKAFNDSSLNIKDVDVIAATAGPGLIGALLVGFTFAKGLAYSLKKKFIPVNHIEGHIFSGFLMDDKPEFPMLVLVVSGGHSMLLLVEDFGTMLLLGSTVDDAAGEAFDKVSKMLGLGYPGGPIIQSLAKKGNPNSIEFPVAVLSGEYDFSFSGLKTSVLRYLQKNFPNQNNIPEDNIPDIAASFQSAVIRALIQKTEKAVNNFDVNSICLVGGVAANESLRNYFLQLGETYNKKVVIPKLEYCGDNAAMIAFRGYSMATNNLLDSVSDKPYPNLKNYFNR